MLNSLFENVFGKRVKSESDVLAEEHAAITARYAKKYGLVFAEFYADSLTYRRELLTSPVFNYTAEQLRFYSELLPYVENDSFAMELSKFFALSMAFVQILRVDCIQHRRNIPDASCSQLQKMFHSFLDDDVLVGASEVASNIPDSLLIYLEPDKRNFLSWAMYWLMCGPREEIWDRVQKRVNKLSEMKASELPPIDLSETETCSNDSLGATNGVTDFSSVSVEYSDPGSTPSPTPTFNMIKGSRAEEEAKKQYPDSAFKYDDLVKEGVILRGF